MKKAVRYLAIAVLGYPLFMLALSWIAVAHMGFPPAVTIPVLMGTSASGLLLFGYVKRKMWLFAAGAAGVMFLSPTPLGVIPLVLGILLLLAFGFVATRAASQGYLEW
ncbi:MAG: hypothetical protein U0P48_01440 [Ancrocorticia sp.]